MFDAVDLSVERLIYVLPAIIIALTFHEFSHGLMAYTFGDPTAKNAGRLTLNPLRHLDPIGGVLLVIAGFGWAKPVPVNPYYFTGQRNRKMLVVALAGPMSNLIQAVIGGFLLKGLYTSALAASYFVNVGVTEYFFNLLQYYISINVVLALFNILPVPPLDGSRILAGLLEGDNIRLMEPLEKYGFALLMALSVFGLMGKIIDGPANSLIYLIYQLCGLL